MTIQILIGKAGDAGITHDLIDKMLRLRTEIFQGRLQWDVNVDGGRESDWYDVIGPHYVIATDQARSKVYGCCRLLPTQGPNMLKDIFAKQLSCNHIPGNTASWEVSRFAIAPEASSASFGFGDIPARMIRALVGFSIARDADSLVGVTTTSFKRLMVGIGFQVDQLGVTTKIGTAMTMAFHLPLTDAVLSRLGVTNHLVAPPLAVAA